MFTFRVLQVVILDVLVKAFRELGIANQFPFFHSKDGRQMLIGNNDFLR